jgi:homoserine kinase
VAAVLSGAGPAVLALTTSAELPGEAVEFGTAKGFAVSEMGIGEAVRWSSGVAVHG